MTISIKHKFASQKADGPDQSVVRPSNWNDIHNVDMAGPRLMGRTANGQGGAQEIPLGEGLEFSGGNLRLIEAIRGYLTPTGMVSPFAGNAAPAGWLFCSGQLVSRTTYADLFAAIGTTYGVGNGATTFGLPDLRDRVVAGRDNMAGNGQVDRLTSPVNGNTLGASGGDQSVSLNINQMPPHNHGGLVGSAGHHGHPMRLAVATSSSSESDTTGGMIIRNRGTGTYGDNTGGAGDHPGQQIGGAGEHQHSIAVQGSGFAHNNVQPTIILNYIIKT